MMFFHITMWALGILMGIMMMACAVAPLFQEKH